MMPFVAARRNGGLMIKRLLKRAFGNSSSQLTPLESLWLTYCKLVKRAADGAKGKTGFERAYYLGYRKALSDVGSEITMQIYRDIVDRVSSGEGSSGASPVQPPAHLQQVPVVLGEETPPNACRRCGLP